ncbi:Lengsin [Holothuria leucospilota]|uniref:Lengsin n=1 Tax=Holothuria leucospilota TaxID=206669 RepID=A0A9Q1BWJ3_HOLLE|nr:Lengsin [Holothuria leucospilota]
MMEKGNSTSIEECVRKIEKLGIKHVRFEFYDLNFIARSKMFPSRHFRKCVEDGIDYMSVSFACDTQANLLPDLDFMKKIYLSNITAYPDLSTFAVLPWVSDTARVFISAPTIDDGGQLTIDPRSIAKKQFKALEERNISLLSSFEFEFTLVDAKTDSTLDEDMSVISTLRLAKHQDFFNKVSENLYQAGVDIECILAEWTKGVYEIPTKPTFGIEAADMAATLRTGLKEMATQNGYTATFLCKPFEDMGGVSAHLNCSLWSLDGQTPLLCDSSRPFGLSEMGEQWIAGVLDHLPALSALLAPTVNCRELFALEEMYGLNATWGIDNRTCSLRVKPKGSYGIYIEHRPISSANNPYISFAAIIAAGLDGIDRKLPLPPPVPLNKNAKDETNIPPGTKVIPKDLETALQCLKKDKVLCDVFGSDFINAFIGIKMHEKKMLSTYCAEKGNDAYKWARKFYMDYI